MIYGEQRLPVGLTGAWDEKIGQASPYPQRAGEPKELTGQFLVHDPLEEGKKMRKSRCKNSSKGKARWKISFYPTSTEKRWERTPALPAEPLRCFGG